jgi:hypothetical protein
MKARRGVEIYLYSFFKCGARLGGRWWTPSPSCWMPASKERDPVPIVQEAGSASGKENITVTSLRTPGCQDCGQPLYWLCSPSCHMQLVTVTVCSATYGHQVAWQISDNFLITFCLYNSNITQRERTGFTSAAHIQVRYNRLYEVFWQFFPIENRIIELISLWLQEHEFHLLLVPVLL